jgi:integrase
VVYNDPSTGKRRTKGGFPKKGDADAWADDFRSSAKRGQWIDPAQGDVIFRDFALQWLATLPTKKAKTRAGYKGLIEGERLDATFGALPLRGITHEAVAGWVGRLSAELAATTVRNNFYVLRAVLDFAVRSRRLQFNPAMGVGLPRVKQSRVREERRYPLSPADVALVCDALPEPWDTYTWLAAWTGMRPEEVSALRLSDVDVDQREVQVRSVLVDVNGLLIREDDPKTVKSRRTIALDAATTQRLATYLIEHQRRAVRWFNEHPDQVHPGEALPIFVGMKTGRANGAPDLDRLDYSKPMRHGLFYNRHWKQTLKAVGLPSNLRFYDLRHAHISWLVSDGKLGIKEISERVGHSSAVMTLDRYAHAPRDAQERQRSALDALSAPTTNTNVVPFRRDGAPR